MLAPDSVRTVAPLAKQCPAVEMNRVPAMGAPHEALQHLRQPVGARIEGDGGDRFMREEAALAGGFGVNVSYSRIRGENRFRGRNINAPIDTVRPDPTAGNVTQVESTASLGGQTFVAGLNFQVPARRIMLFANYAWLKQETDADGAFDIGRVEPAPGRVVSTPSLCGDQVDIQQRRAPPQRQRTEDGIGDGRQPTEAARWYRESAEQTDIAERWPGNRGPRDGAAFDAQERNVGRVRGRCAKCQIADTSPYTAVSSGRII